MKFDLAKYMEVKQVIFDKIKSSYECQEDKRCMVDGIIAPEIYNREKFKIACFLGESYSYDKTGVVDIEDQPNANILAVGRPRRHTATKIPILLWLIFESMERKHKISRDDFPKFLRSNDKNTKVLQCALAKSAWINVKKDTKHIDKSCKGSTRQDNKEIYTRSKKNEDILRLQIESIAPDLMIVCSNPVFNSLADMKLLGEGIERNSRLKMQKNHLGQFVIHVNHPGYLKDWGYRGIYNTFESIYDVIIQ